MAERPWISSLIAALTPIAQAIVAVFSYLLALHKSKRQDKEDKKRAEAKKNVEKAEKEVDDVCNNGNLSELLDATKKLGDAKSEASKLD